MTWYYDKLRDMRERLHKLVEINRTNSKVEIINKAKNGQIIIT